MEIIDKRRYKKPVVARDIKPGNLFSCPNSKVIYLRLKSYEDIVNQRNKDAVVKIVDMTTFHQTVISGATEVVEVKSTLTLEGDK